MKESKKNIWLLKCSNLVAGVLVIAGIFIYIIFLIAVGCASRQIMPEEYYFCAYGILILVLTISSIKNIRKKLWLKLGVSTAIGVFQGMIIIFGFFLIFQSLISLFKLII